jgi:hypothetical protein
MGSKNQKHVPTDATRKMVLELTGFGLEQQSICSYLDINDDTLRKYYREEITIGKMQTNLRVLQTAYAKACSPDPRNNAMTIFWLKTRCGWREKEPVDPAQTVATVLEAMRPLSPVEWQEKYGSPPTSEINGAG